MRQRARWAAAATAAALALSAAACSDDDTATEPTVSRPTTTTANDTTVTTSSLTATSASAADRCAANRAAGRITYLSGFDFAAAASIVDVIVADRAGYYEELCLDVELQPSISTANYPIVAANDAQFASGGSFSEVARFAAANDADLVAAAVEGRTAIDALLLKPGTATVLADLAGTTIGVKFAMSTAVAAMLAGAGLTEGEDYETVLIDGFDPVAHMAIESIVGFPGWKSNEPGILERAGVDFDLFDPTEHDVPGSFGVIFTNRAFVDEHPAAAQDFLRATMRGLADAIADPAAASAAALELVEAGGNPNFLSAEGETFRWATEAALISDLQPAGTGLGVPDVELLQAEIDAYAEVGLFADGDVPVVADRLAADVFATIYDDAGELIWPA